MNERTALENERRALAGNRDDPGLCDAIAKAVGGNERTRQALLDLVFGNDRAARERAVRAFSESLDRPKAKK